MKNVGEFGENKVYVSNFGSKKNKEIINSGETKDAEERKCSHVTEMGSAVNNIYLVT